jgi:hypothetical protein
METRGKMRVDNMPYRMKLKELYKSHKDVLLEAGISAHPRKVFLHYLSM